MSTDQLVRSGPASLAGSPPVALPSGCRRRWLELAAVTGVGVLAIAVRLPGVWGRPFWEDEVASARVISEPTLAMMLRQVVRTESTPPFWYGLLWLLHQAGLPVEDGRLVSVLSGGVLAVLVVTLARRVVSPPLALLAGVLASLGGEFVAHGRELRAYELFAVLSVLFAHSLLAYVEAPTRLRAVALGAVTAAAALTHFFFVFTLMAAVVWLLLEPGLRPVRWRLLRPIAAGAAVAALWLPLMLTQYHPGRFGWIGRFELRNVIAVPLRLFSYAFIRPGVGPTLSTLALFLVVYGAVRLARRSAAGRLVAMLALAPLAEAAIVWACGMPIFDLRNMIGIGSFVAIAAVAAFTRLPSPAAVAGAAAIVALAAASLAVAGLGYRPPYDRIAATLTNDGWNGSQPIAVFGDPHRFRLPLMWYLRGQPALTITPLPDGPCGDIYVVRASGAVTLHSSNVPPSHDPALRGAHLLTTQPFRCRASRATKPIS